MNNGKIAVRIGLVYMPQESRTKKDKLQIIYDNIAKQIQKAEFEKQHILICGDFNCKIGEKIPRNDAKVTMGGKMLLTMLKKHNLMVVNATEKCRGVWTRTQGNEKSILDYIIMKESDEDNIVQMVIDEDKIWAPYKLEAHNNDINNIYSDHNAILLTLNWILTEK